MRMILPATTALAAILLAGAFTSGAAAAECGTVTIASMNWQSAEGLCCKESGHGRKSAGDFRRDF